MHELHDRSCATRITHCETGWHHHISVLSYIIGSADWKRWAVPLPCHCCRGFSAYATASATSEALEPQASVALSPVGSPGAAGAADELPRCLEISLSAVGMGLQFLQLHTPSGGSSGEGGAERPGSRASRHSRQASMDSGSGGGSAQPSRQASVSDMALQAQQAQRPRQVRARALALYTLAPLPPSPPRR